MHIFPCLVIRIESDVVVSSLDATTGSATRSTSIDIADRGVRKERYNSYVDYASNLTSYHRPPGDSLPFRSSRFRLGTVQDLLELGYTMTHARVHVSLATVDVVVEVVAEQLDV